MGLSVKENEFKGLPIFRIIETFDTMYKDDSLLYHDEYKLEQSVLHSRSLKPDEIIDSRDTFDSVFVSENIRTSAKMLDSIISYNFTMKRKSKQIYYNIEFYYNDSMYSAVDRLRIRNRLSYYHELIELMSFIGLSDLFYDKLQISTIDIRLYDIGLKKVFPESSEDKLSPDNVNSGFATHYTSPDNDYASIDIYRTEEMSKVLIHELVHALQMDIRISKQMEDIIASKFPRDPRHAFLLNETVVDSMTFVILSIYVGLRNGIDPLTELYIQTKYSLYQAQKILNFYSISLEACFNSAVLKESHTLMQSSAVSSYYIVKPFALANFFFGNNVCLITKALFDFKSTDQKRSESLVKSIIDMRSNPEFKVFFERNERNVDEYIRPKHTLANSLRMSLFLE